MRIIFVPQFPSKEFLRYPLWWFTEFPKQFKKAGFEVITLGQKYKDELNSNDFYSIGERDFKSFSPLYKSIDFETEQIREYMKLDLRDDDILFLADISYPAIFPNILFHKKPKRCFVFCHATSINKFDYFESIKQYKYPVETSHAAMFNKVFVGSKYHKQKLHWSNTVITYLPFPPFKTFPKEEKTIDIISASRPTPQKVDLELEAEVEKKFGKIKRMECDSWEQYYKFLGQSKVLLISAHEDTFGYQIVDAILNGCVPIARNSLAYPEILSGEYLYDSKWELIHMIKKVLGGDYHYSFPKILCEKQMDNFYKKIVNEMKGE